MCKERTNLDYEGNLSAHINVGHFFQNRCRVLCLERSHIFNCVVFILFSIVIIKERKMALGLTLIP